MDEETAYLGEYHVYLGENGTVLLHSTDGRHTRMGRLVMPGEEVIRSDRSTTD